ncbi:DUF6515 family protein [Sulfurimonas sp. HSL1-6]|uniref:DUF6515 family protein n=1 Tax=Thiomicrolovo immobilis TaxID=3131935 RepID=UPI0031F86AE5
MRYSNFISVTAALLIGSAGLHAAPDHDGRKDNDRGGSKQERSYNNKQDRAYSQERSNSRSNTLGQEIRRDRTQPSKGEIRREEVRRSEPQKYTPHPVRPAPVVRPNQREENRYTEQRTVRPQKGDQRNVGKRVAPPAKGGVVHIDKHKHYYRPPGARPLTYYQRPGYVVRSLPRVAISLSLGGLVFYYADGLYYRHHDRGFIVAAPPVGLVVRTLPVGYTVFVHSGLTYYYYADVYYTWDTYRNAYRVVNPPVTYYDVEFAPGQVLDYLPDGAYSVTINGAQYYRYANTYFMQAIQGDRVVYIVVTP